MNATTEMPKYKCHKEVHALKITAIDHWKKGENCGAILVANGAAVEVDNAYLDKHNPQAGGYYVVYADGYKSYSPAQAFEEGYTRIEP